MRTLLAIACLLLCGCDFMSHRGPGPTREISDASGQHRLMMRYVAVDRGYDFDALIWRTRDAGNWKQRLIITQDDFERGSERQRWVSDIHSFDPVSGHAIIKVAEGDAPKTATTTVHYGYSWREWSLLTNGEVRLIRTCADPFEKY
jgi:hypothetical protein